MYIKFIFKFEPIEYTNAINIVLGLLLFTSPQSTSLSIASPSLSKKRLDTSYLRTLKFSWSSYPTVYS